MSREPLEPSRINVVRRFKHNTCRTAASSPCAIVGLAAVAFNALANYALIFGRLGMPALGIFGSGLATTISQTLMVSALFVAALVDPRMRRLRLFALPWRPAPREMAALWRLGLPIGGTILAEVGVFSSSTLLVGLIDRAALEAHTDRAPDRLARLHGSARPRAGGDRSGRARLWRARPGRAEARGLVGLRPHPDLRSSVRDRDARGRRLLIAPFMNVEAPDNAAAVAIATTLLGIAALFQIFDASQATLANMLRGVHNSRVPHADRASRLLGDRRAGWRDARLLQLRSARSGSGSALRLASPSSPSCCCCAGSARSGEASRSELRPRDADARGKERERFELLTFHVSDFRQHQHYGPTVANRVWNAWWKDAGRALSDVERHMIEMADDRPLMALVAHGADSYLGSALLIHSDMEERPELSPWVAALWVEAAARKRGVGRALVAEAAKTAAALGYPAAYLCCRPELEGFYSGIGWTLIEQAVGAKGLSVLRLDLAPGAR